MSEEPLTHPALPERIESEAELEELLTRPSAAAVDAVRRLKGDLLVLGGGGKMGPTLCLLARRAVRAAGTHTRIIAASQVWPPGVRERLDEAGIETLEGELLDLGTLERLPDAPNVVFMVGMKFGSTGQQALTWAINTWLPGNVALRYRGSRIVALSTGNVYPFRRAVHGGATEAVQPAPVGEYAQSCLGRERILEHMSRTYGTQMAIFRLNYAVELRYGVLLDIAQRVYRRQPVDLTMGAVNVIWQGDANERILRCFALCASPPQALNVTGPESVSVRWLGSHFGDRFGVEPVFEGVEEETALLSNAAGSFGRFGYPAVPLARVLNWVAHWVRSGGPTLDKPTHFDVRDGKF